MSPFTRTLCGAVGAVVLAVFSAARCAAPAGQPAGDGRTTPVYNKVSGRLEQLVSDRDGDGKMDTRAFMDGALVKSIEIDRDQDGAPDRWEYYQPAPPGHAGPQSLIERAEEGVGQKIVRREFYTRGVLERTEQDSDRDGRVDKWEYYQGDVLARVELDLEGRGRPDRRLVYGADGNVVRVEVDPDGDGTFVAAPATPVRKSGGV